MKSAIWTVVLMGTLTVGNSLAQGRGNAPDRTEPRGPSERAVGRPAEPGVSNRAERAAERSNSRSTERGTDKSADRSRDRDTSRIRKDISDRPQLAANLQKLLPAGTKLDVASDGFKNLGQFVAAVHVSQNLGVSFDQLKAKMVTDDLSLGDSIHALKPNLNEDQIKTEVKKAEEQAKQNTKNKS
jgi:hypothetical protein